MWDENGRILCTEQISLDVSPNREIKTKCRRRRRWMDEDEKKKMMMMKEDNEKYERGGGHGGDRTDDGRE